MPVDPTPDLIARTPKQIGDAIRRHRRKRGLTQSTAGERADMRQATVSSLENGEPGSGIGTLCDLLLAMDLELVIRPRTKMSADDLLDIY